MNVRGTVCMCACPCLFKVPEVLSVQLLNALLELFGLLDVASGCVQAGFDVLDLNTQVLNLQVYRTQRGAQGVALWNSKVCVRMLCVLWLCTVHLLSLLHHVRSGGLQPEVLSVHCQLQRTVVPALLLQL